MISPPPIAAMAAASHLPVTVKHRIGIDKIDVMVAKMNEFPEWPVYKVKLGTDHDLEIVRELRRHTKARFRVDANCGWSADETIRNSTALKELDVEFIEQPLPAGRWDEQRRVYAESALPVFADESCIVPTDVSKCAGFFHGINIKLVKCGGLTPARRMIAEARQLGLQVMVGCMTESTVGISAIAQLLPLLDYVDMDGALLLARDIADGVTIEQPVTVAEPGSQMASPAPAVAPSSAPIPRWKRFPSPSTSWTSSAARTSSRCIRR